MFLSQKMKRTHNDLFDPNQEVKRRTERIEELVYYHAETKTDSFEYMEEKIRKVLQIIEKHRVIHMNNKMTKCHVKFEEEYTHVKDFVKHMSHLTLDNPLKYPFLFFVFLASSEITNYLYTKEDTVFDTDLERDIHIINNNLFLISNFINLKKNVFYFAFKDSKPKNTEDLKETYAKYKIDDECLENIIHQKITNSESDDEISNTNK
jgi:hypothetical protein